MLPISLFDELYGLIKSENPYKIGHFKRRMRELPEEQRKEIWGKLQDRGVNQFDISAKDIISTADKFTEDEWNLLAKTVWEIRKNDPTVRLIDATNTAMDSLPKERRLVLHNGNQLKIIYDKLTEIDTNYRKNSEEYEALSDLSKEIKSKEEILRDLNYQDLVSLKKRVLDICNPDELLEFIPKESVLETVSVPEIMSCLYNRTLEHMEDVVSKNTAELLESIRVRESHVEKKLNVKMPRILIVGLLGDQQRIIQQKLNKEFIVKFQDKNNQSIQGEQDLTLIFANFVSHSLTNQASKVKFAIVHHGGITKAVDKALTWKKDNWG